MLERPVVPPVSPVGEEVEEDSISSTDSIGPESEEEDPEGYKTPILVNGFTEYTKFHRRELDKQYGYIIRRSKKAGMFASNAFHAREAFDRFSYACVYYGKWEQEVLDTPSHPSVTVATRGKLRPHPYLRPEQQK
jgi:hypothetical protein